MFKHKSQIRNLNYWFRTQAKGVTNITFFIYRLSTGLCRFVGYAPQRLKDALRKRQ